MEEGLGRGVKTIENYRRYVRRFLTHTKVKDVADISESKVEEYGTWLGQQRISVQHSGQLKQNTVNYHLTALRVFLSYIKKQGFTTVDYKKILLNKTSKQSREIVSNDELDKFFSVVGGRSVKELRDKAICYLLFSTGIRVSELCALDSDVDLSQNKLHIKGSNGIERVIPMPLESKNAVLEYLRARTDKDEALFVNNGKHTTINGSTRLTPRSVQRIVKFYTKKAGISKEITPQQLRHMYATRLLDGTQDLPTVQSYLGHTNTTITKSYLNSLRQNKTKTKTQKSL